MNELKAKLVERKNLVTFILVTSLFSLWGFANDITNPMVAAFQTIMELSASKASMVQFAFYGGYATMAIPAALFIKKYSYKAGILVGLALYAIGAFMFIPAAEYQMFSFFCISLYVFTFGLAFLETTANPYILSLGAPENATRRLNLAQAFNPMGSLCGMFIASNVILSSLESDTEAVRAVGFSTLDQATKEAIRLHDLAVIRDPYVALGCVVVFVFIVISIFVKKDKKEESEEPKAKDSLRRLAANPRYREGVIAQMFYVAAQIMCWTFIIQYADRLGIDKSTAQKYNIAAMSMFLCSRFISTFLMKYVNGSRLLMIFAICAMCTTAGTILIDGMGGLYCLVATSAFMSLMFPTIYGIALEGVDKDKTLGAAFLVMAIVGGALMPPMQGAIIDLGTVAGMASVNFSFILPFVCFCIIAVYGFRTIKPVLK
jgi:FHS family L-fucose permease-like MFS transporter